MANRRIRLVSNWHQGLKFWSTRFLLAALTLKAAWPEVSAAMPPSLASQLPVEFGEWVTFLLVLAGLLARFVDQGLERQAEEGGHD